ncbi:MAG: hypothetical protein SFW09_10280 [Hyphomicrobiaceae bacterium]|nr:hypothetical protein [Hyphomicrobiaceae bacterium]
MTAFSYRFVAVVFGILALSFLASTASVISEFRDTELIAILSANSYLFVFFPTLGIVALAAFYIPAVIFTDIYVTQARAGPLRLGIGALAAVGLSLFFAEQLNDTRLRGIWEVSPEALAANARRPAQCLDGNRICVQPVLPVIADLRQKSLERIRISPFIRECSPDSLMEPAAERALVRYCFPAKQKLDAEQCCRVNKAFAAQVFALWENPATRSKAAQLDRILLPFKAFFIIVIMLIGILLIAWKRTLKAAYSGKLVAMERGLQIGAAAMLLWPVMDYAYQQTSDVLYGPASSFPLRLSLVVVPWALLLTFYFADKVRIELARLVQIVGSALSGVAILRYQDISDWSSKLVGLGASSLNFLLLIVLGLAVIIMLLVWLHGTMHGEEVLEAEPDNVLDGSEPPLT